MHYKEKWKANRINCKLLRMIKSCYQVNETGWYTIKCTLQTHLCHNNDVPGCAPGPGEAGKLPEVFFFHKQYILSSLWFIIYQWLFQRSDWSPSIWLVWSQPIVKMNFTSFGRISMKDVCVFYGERRQLHSARSDSSRFWLLNPLKQFCAYSLSKITSEYGS